MSEDSRADRLRERRRSSTDRAGRDDPTDDASQRDDADAAGTSTGEGDEETDGETSVKDEQVGTYMYLPEEQHRRLDHVYNRLKADYEFAFEEDFEKNRHFFPLVVEYGLDTLADLDAEEVRDRLDER